MVSVNRMSEGELQISDTMSEYRTCESSMWESIDPASKTREIFFDNGDTLPARFNVDFKDIKEGEMIGDGMWGPVHKAHWLGREVAVKKFNKTESQNVLLMGREVNPMLRLRHPNVLKLFGFYLLAQEDMYVLKSTMIMELMDCDLQKYIANRKVHGDLPFSSDESLYIISQIATGMNHMHKLQYFHRDLKPQNVLVRQHPDTVSSFCAEFKIADFGCSEFMGESVNTPCDRNAGTLRYKAPEQFDPSAKLLPEKVDVYSFAVLCSKILTGEEPYGRHAGSLREHISSGGKPSIPYQDLPADFAVLLKECLDINPEARPSFEKICGTLVAIMQNRKKLPIPRKLPSFKTSAGSGDFMDSDGSSEQDLLEFVVDWKKLPRDFINYFIDRGELSSTGECDIGEVEWKGCIYAAKKIPDNICFMGVSQTAKMFPRLCHKNIVTFMGYSASSLNSTMIITELMQESLREFLVRKSQAGATKPFDEATSRLMMLEVATGMAYLHSKDVLHGDLHTMNILVTECEDRIVVKLTDFWNRHLDRFSPSWVPPEGIGKCKSSNICLKKWDVYSFGMVCYEILTGEPPFVYMPPKQREKNLSRGKRPKLPKETSQDLKDLIEKCWHHDFTHRPHFSEICKFLSGS